MFKNDFTTKQITKRLQKLLSNSSPYKEQIQIFTQKLDYFIQDPFITYIDDLQPKLNSMFDKISQQITIINCQPILQFLKTLALHHLDSKSHLTVSIKLSKAFFKKWLEVITLSYNHTFLSNSFIQNKIRQVCIFILEQFYQSNNNDISPGKVSASPQHQRSKLNKFLILMKKHVPRFMVESIIQIFQQAMIQQNYHSVVFQKVIYYSKKKYKYITHIIQNSLPQIEQDFLELMEQKLLNPTDNARGNLNIVSFLGILFISDQAFRVFVSNGRKCFKLKDVLGKWLSYIENNDVKSVGKIGLFAQNSQINKTAKLQKQLIKKLQFRIVQDGVNMSTQQFLVEVIAHNLSKIRYSVTGAQLISNEQMKQKKMNGCALYANLIDLISQLFKLILQRNSTEKQFNKFVNFLSLLFNSLKIKKISKLDFQYLKSIGISTNQGGGKSVQDTELSEFNGMMVETKIDKQEDKIHLIKLLLLGQNDRKQLGGMNQTVLIKQMVNQLIKSENFMIILQLFKHSPLFEQIIMLIDGILAVEEDQQQLRFHELLKFRIIFLIVFLKSSTPLTLVLSIVVFIIKKPSVNKLNILCKFIEEINEQYLHQIVHVLLFMGYGCDEYLFYIKLILKYISSKQKNNFELNTKSAYQYTLLYCDEIIQSQFSIQKLRIQQQSKLFTELSFSQFYQFIELLITNQNYDENEFNQRINTRYIIKVIIQILKFDIDFHKKQSLIDLWNNNRNQTFFSRIFRQISHYLIQASQERGGDEGNLISFLQTLFQTKPDYVKFFLDPFYQVEPSFDFYKNQEEKESLSQQMKIKKLHKILSCNSSMCSMLRVLIREHFDQFQIPFEIYIGILTIEQGKISKAQPYMIGVNQILLRVLELLSDNKLIPSIFLRVFHMIKLIPKYMKEKVMDFLRLVTNYLKELKNQFNYVQEAIVKVPHNYDTFRDILIEWMADCKLASMI